MSFYSALLTIPVPLMVFVLFSGQPLAATDASGLRLRRYMYMYTQATTHVNLYKSFCSLCSMHNVVYTMFFILCADVFLPSPEALLVNLRESKEVG